MEAYEVGIRNLRIEGKYYLKNNDHAVKVYNLPRNEIEEIFRGIGPIEYDGVSLKGYHYDGNPLKADKVKVIRECMENGMSAKEISLKYKYDLRNVKKTMKQITRFDQKRKC